MLARLNALQPVGLLLVRILLGVALMFHGYPKLFDNAQYLERFPQMGFPAWTVYVAGAVEFFGGLLLVLGLFNRFAAFLISGQFAVAFVMVHWRVAERGLFGFLGSSRDEYPLLICLVAFLLFVGGAGALSLDRLIFKDKA